ncbi:MAG TPA: exosortase/archaeosortase family protein [Pyrinomonadaceae bacterium]|nr:exosortase/archaeosortase family protein [Pyrinomonadaceae bacterium]
MSVTLSAPGTKHLWRIVAISSALAFAYAAVLAKLGQTWWTDENYSHGLLIPLIIGYILWSQRARLAGTVQRPTELLGLTTVLFALFALWAGTAGAELYMQRMSLVLLLAGIVLYFWGFHLLRLLIAPLFLLILAIPIPAIIFNKIAFPLQLFASRCAVGAMMLFDIPVLRQGNVIELMPLGARETKKLEVVEACSGIRSLMTLVTLAVVFAYFTHPRGGNPSDGESGISRGSQMASRLKKYGLFRSSVIVLSAVPIAILTNALRVSGTGVLAHYYGTQVADGFFHSFSGWVIYVVAFLMLFAVGWLLDRVKPKVRETVKDENKNLRTAPITFAPAEGVE